MTWEQILSQYGYPALVLILVLLGVGWFVRQLLWPFIVGIIERQQAEIRAQQQERVQEREMLVQVIQDISKSNNENQIRTIEALSKITATVDEIRNHFVLQRRRGEAGEKDR